MLHQIISIDTSTQTNTYYKEAIRLSKNLNDTLSEIKSHNFFGEHCRKHNAIDSATYFFTLGLNLARVANEPGMQVYSLIHLSFCTSARLAFDESLVFLNEALAVSRKSNAPKDIALALQELGVFHYEEHNYEEALLYFNEELRYDQELNDSNARASAYNNIGAIYSKTGQYTQSIRSYKKALEIESSLKNEYAVAACQTNIGIAYKEQGDYNLALDHLLQAARYYDQSKLYREQASCYSTIANIQIEQGNFDNALSYHQSALELRKKVNHQKGVANSLTNIGQTYIKKGDYDLAIDFLNRSLKLKTELKDKQMMAISMDLLGEVYFLKNEYGRAQYYYHQSLELKASVQDPKGKAETYNKLGNLYLAWGKYDLALQQLELARSVLATSNVKKELLKNYLLTTQVLRANGDYKNALLFYDRYETLKDTLQNENQHKALAELQIKYETEKKEQEIVSLNERDKTQAALLDKQHTLIYLLVGVVLLFILVAALLFYINRSRKKLLYQNQIIIQQKQTIIDQKQVLMRELHHRVKNNLQILSSILELQKDRIKDESTQEMLQAVSTRLNAMLLIHKNLYHDTLSAQIEIPIYLNALLDNLFDSYGYTKQQIQLEQRIAPVLLDADRALSIGFIYNELISNVLKHAFNGIEKPVLCIAFDSNEKQMELLVKDNGSGMKDIQEIERSNSFGIRLMRLFAADLEGEIAIDSNQQGTTISVIIPHLKTRL
ncbi:MAG: tetratricopeptide repeat-containing sensor histidine kinase [Bacteroidia bacterium]